MKKILLSLVLVIELSLSANQSLASHKFCKNITITKDYMQITPTRVANILVGYAHGAISTSITMTSHTKDKLDKNLIYMGSDTQVNKVLVEACKLTDNLIAKSSANYYQLLIMSIVSSAIDNKE